MIMKEVKANQVLTIILVNSSLERNCLPFRLNGGEIHLSFDMYRKFLEETLGGYMNTNKPNKFLKRCLRERMFGDDRLLRSAYYFDMSLAVVKNLLLSGGGKTPARITFSLVSEDEDLYGSIELRTVAPNVIEQFKRLFTINGYTWNIASNEHSVLELEKAVKLFILSLALERSIN